MYRRILIAVALLLGLVAGALAKDEDSSSDKLAGKASVEFIVIDGKIPAGQLQDGKGFTATLEIGIHTDDRRLEQPTKYQVSWTVGRKWLSKKKPNPDHRRRGNLFVDVGEEWTHIRQLKVFVPAGKTLRLRVRPFYADKTRGEDCVVTGSLFDFGNGNGYLHNDDGCE